MVNPTYEKLGSTPSMIRELFAYGLRRSAEVGPEHVYDYSLGNPSIPAPQPVQQALLDVLHDTDPIQVHGYSMAGGFDGTRRAVAEDLTHRFGMTIRPEELFFTCGAAAALISVIRALTVSPDSEFVAIAPYFPEYLPFVESNGGKLVSVPADLDTFQISLDILEAHLTSHTQAVLVNSPNNPTGAVYSREQLKAWVEYALEQNAVILFDAAYEAFIRDEALPRSIYEIEGAERCAIEFCSFSKTAGFTGTRCGWTVVPLSLETEGMSLNHMWLRRQTTKFNGVPYIVQRGAAAVFTPEGQRQTAEGIAYYRENARLIADALTGLGIWYTGGVNSPYVWLACPDGMDSWTFFDRLLEKAQVVGTPGAGFGRNGEGYFRLTAFGDRDRTRQAVERLRRLSLSGR
mgnify:CR=1 FL=1